MSLSLELMLSGIGLFITVLVNIAAIAYFAGSLNTNQAHQKEMIQELKNEFSKQFESLEKKQDKHNSVIERQYCVEGAIKVLEEKVEVANHRIADLELAR